MKQDPAVEVSANEYFIAVERWHTYWKGCEDAHASFQHFLGMSDEPVRGKEHPPSSTFRIHVRQSAARKIRMLNSPHYYALLTAYRITKCQSKKL